MIEIKEILKLKLKPKEKVVRFAEELKNGKGSIDELVKYFKDTSDVERGTCLSALAHIVKTNPEFIKNHLDFVFEQINDKAPRVKWEAGEIVGHVAGEFPDKVVKAIPKLLKNTMNEGTVVKWSAAYALTEIARGNPRTMKELAPIFEKIVDSESNSGVKNVYLKALKVFKKKTK